LADATAEARGCANALEIAEGDEDDIDAVGAFASAEDDAPGGVADKAPSVEGDGAPTTVSAQAPPRAARIADAPARLVRR